MKYLKRTGMLSVFLFLSTALLTLGLKGGPVYPGTGTTKQKVSVFGTYAGTLAPTTAVTGVASLGLFTFDVPATGLGSGTISLFVNGNAYTGTIQGLADPDSKLVTAFIDSGFDYITTVPSGTDSDGNLKFTTTTVRAVATGAINGQVKKSGNKAQTAARLSGTAIVTFDGASADAFNLPPSIGYTVVGFKQAGT